MGNQEKNIPNNDPSQHKKIADDLNITHVHEAARRIFDDLEVVPEQYEEIDDIGQPGLAEEEQTSSKTRIEELENEVAELQAKYRKEGSSELRRKINKLSEEIFWRREGNDPGKPLNNDPK